jgi:hypothetical protein
LQHGLMLMWEEAARGKTGEPIALDGAIVEKAGGLAELLSGHADRVMDAAAPDARRASLVESIFRELTDVNAEGSAIRRPRALRDLAAVAGGTPDELRPLIDAFRAPGVSFLTPYAPAPLNEKTVVDISHEALIRCWRRIASPKDGWLKQEFDDGLAWRSLLSEARAFERDQRRVLSAAARSARPFYEAVLQQRQFVLAAAHRGDQARGQRLVDRAVVHLRGAANGAHERVLVHARHEILRSIDSLGEPVKPRAFAEGIPSAW